MVTHFESKEALIGGPQHKVESLYLQTSNPLHRIKINIKFSNFSKLSSPIITFKYFAPIAFTTLIKRYLLKKQEWKRRIWREDSLNLLNYRVLEVKVTFIEAQLCSKDFK